MALLPLLTWAWIRHTQELPPVVHPEGVPKPQVWHLLREPLMRRLLLVNWLLSSCWDVHTFVVPVLGHERAFSASVIGAILGSFAVAAACVRVAMPLLAAHLREWVVVSCAMLTTALLRILLSQCGTEYLHDFPELEDLTQKFVARHIPLVAEADGAGGWRIPAARAKLMLQPW